MSFNQQIKELQNGTLIQTQILEQLNHEIIRIDEELVEIDSYQREVKTQISAEKRLLRTNKALASDYSAAVEDINCLEAKVSRLTFRVFLAHEATKTIFKSSLPMQKHHYSTSLLCATGSLLSAY